jgi:hypothetical protein
MGRFVIQRCRPLQSGLSEFIVRLLSGEIRQDDTFSCRGAYQHTQFRVQSILQSPSQATLVCAGSVAFDDEFAGITLDTDQPRLPPLNLPILANPPTATPEETRTLETVISDWETRAPAQRAACLCLLRGADTHEKIGLCLGITADEVKTILKGVWGILYDSSQDKLLFK